MATVARCVSTFHDSDPDSRRRGAHLRFLLLFVSLFVIGVPAAPGPVHADDRAADDRAGDGQSDGPSEPAAASGSPQPYADTIDVAAATTADDERASDAADVLALPPVVTVGTRTPRPLDQVPASVSQISARQLEYAQASNMGEALASLPGVAMEGGPRANGTFLNVRGLSGPRVLLIVDGARQNFLGGHRSALLVDPEMLKQVELLRGPASALWGSDALGGVVVMQTKDAADFLDDGQRLAGRARAGFESASGERVGSGVVAARAGGFDLVVNGVTRQADSYERGDGSIQPNTGIGVASNVIKASWLPDTGPHSVSISRQSFVQDSVSPSNPSTTVTDTNPLIDRTNDTTYTNARYTFDGLGWLRAGQVNLYRDDLFIREDRVDEPRADRTEFITNGASSHLTLALPWALGGAGESLLTVGMDGFRDHSEARRNGEARPQFPDADRQMAGAFIQAQVPLGPLSIVPGVRYDRYQAQSNQGDAEDIEASKVSPKLGLVYELAPGLRMRAAMTSAFRAPGLIEVYAAGQHFLGNDFQPNPQLRPESARNLELGFSFDLPGFADGHQSLLTGSVYRNRVDDYIELFVTVEEEVPSARCVGLQLPAGCVNRNDDGTINPLVPPIFIGGITSSRNLDSATLTGGELEAAYGVGPWRLGATFSRVRGEDDTTGQPLLTIPADTLRTSIDLLPDFTPARWTRGLGATLAYTRHLAQDRVPTFTDEDGNPQNVIPTTPAHGFWDLSLSWEPLGQRGRAFGLRAPRLVAGIDNLTDASYRNHLNVIESPGRNLRISLSAGF